MLIPNRRLAYLSAVGHTEQPRPTRRPNPIFVRSAKDQWHQERVKIGNDRKRKSTLALN
jgi:hypothetical protein